MIVALDDSGIMCVGGDLLPTNMSAIELYAMHEKTVVWVDGEKDGEQIMLWLFAHGYHYCDKGDKTFSATVSTQRRLYSITVRVMKGIKYSIYNIHNMLPKSSPESITRYFRQKTHVEMIYSVARFLEDHDVTGPTASVAAMREYRKRGDYYSHFPDDELWHGELAQLYRGGIVNGKVGEYGTCVAYDCNSMYPSMLVNHAMPIGIPEHYEGPCEDDRNYPYHVDYIVGHVNHSRDLPPIEGLYQDDDMQDDGIVNTWLTNIDVAMLKESVGFEVLESREGYRFQAAKGLFRSYVEQWYDLKRNAHGPVREIAKLMENSLVGRFGVGSFPDRNIPYVNNNGGISYTIERTEKTTPNYAPVAWFVTSLARRELMRVIKANRKRLIYTDTDSVILEGVEGANGIVKGVGLGEWKREVYKRMNIIGVRRYAYERMDGTTGNVLAGMPMNTTIPIEEFKHGKRVTSSTGHSFVL